MIRLHWLVGESTEKCFCPPDHDVSREGEVDG